MKTFGIYVFIIAMGCGVGAVAADLDAGGKFIPQEEYDQEHPVTPEPT